MAVVGYAVLNSVLFALCLVAPQPYGMTVFSLIGATFSLRFGVLIARRTRMRYAAAALFLGALLFVGMAATLLIGGHTFDTLPGWAWWLLGAGALAAVVLLHVEPWAHPEEWEAWARRMNEVNLREMLRGDHIPDLSGRRMQGRRWDRMFRTERER